MCGVGRHPGRRAGSEPNLPGRGTSGLRQNDHCNAVLARGIAPGRARSLCRDVGDETGARASREAPRLAARRPRHLRTGAGGGHARPRQGAYRAPSRRGRSERNHASDFLQGGGGRRHTGRDRQPVRAAPACTRTAALPPPGTGAEAPLCALQLHRSAARRPHGGAWRSATPFDGARRRPARAARDRLRRPAPAHQHPQDARHPIQWRFSRPFDRARRHRDLSASGGRRAPYRIHRRLRAERQCRSRQPAGRRPRARHERPADRCSGRR